jgi:hypothetical protein
VTDISFHYKLLTRRSSPAESLTVAARPLKVAGCGIVSSAALQGTDCLGNIIDTLPDDIPTTQRRLQFRSIPAPLGQLEACDMPVRQRSKMTEPQVTKASPAHFLFGALGGGGSSGIIPPPTLVAVAPPPSRSEDKLLPASGLLLPGMAIAKVCPSLRVKSFFGPAGR